MDPCPYVRLIIESLALKLPPATSKPAAPGAVHPSTSSSPCLCTLHLQPHPFNPQTTPLPIVNCPSVSLTEAPGPASLSSPPVIFTLDSGILTCSLIVTVYSGKLTGPRTCGLGKGARLGHVRVRVDVEAGRAHAAVMQSGWVSLGRNGSRLHLVVRTEPDPRYVFGFGGEPECSPVVYQMQVQGAGVMKQPVFSCRFSADRRRSTRSRSFPSETSRSSTIKGWLAAFGSQRDLRRKDQRKGWTVTIHDLSGSPVAAASMITPFVPSPGSDRVSKSNPGAWLILRATGSSTGNWKPWGRFEAWRERCPIDALGYKFELVTDNGPTNSLLIAQSTINIKKGGVFKIDASVGGDDVARLRTSGGGFVMESTVEGEGKMSKPTVQVGVQHVSSMGDVALFVALSAAVDLSMDACQLFSHKLRKELCRDQQEYSL